MKKHIGQIVNHVKEFFRARAAEFLGVVIKATAYHLRRYKQLSPTKEAHLFDVHVYKVFVVISDWDRLVGSDGQRGDDGHVVAAETRPGTKTTKRF